MNLFDRLTAFFAQRFDKDDEEANADEYILGLIKTYVWSGQYSKVQVKVLVAEWVAQQGSGSEAMLVNAVEQQFKAKRKAEKTWPERLDYDRLNEAFERLTEEGILCLHNAGFTDEDALANIQETLEQSPKKHTAYCFYTEQAMSNAIASKGLVLSFDTCIGDVEGRHLVAEKLTDILRQSGLAVSCDKSAEGYIALPMFDWKVRS